MDDEEQPDQPAQEQPQSPSPPQKSHLWMAIVVAVLAFLSILIFVMAAVMIGDRSGAGSGAGMVGTGPTGPSGAGCSDVLAAAEQYINRGIGYSQNASLRCGPRNSTGPQGVVALDCSGYISRAYHDAGQLSNSGWCLNTVGIASSTSNYTRIAADIPSARANMQPGDVLLFGLGNPSGPPTKTSSSHAVIYGGKSGTTDIVYESGGRGGGPHRSVYNVFGGGRQLYGVYRSKGCQATNQQETK